VQHRLPGLRRGICEMHVGCQGAREGCSTAIGTRTGRPMDPPLRPIRAGNTSRVANGVKPDGPRFRLGEPGSPVSTTQRMKTRQNRAEPRYLTEMAPSPCSEFGDGSAVLAPCLRRQFLVSRFWWVGLSMSPVSGCSAGYLATRASSIHLF
jgi:hypothetical protein